MGGYAAWFDSDYSALFPGDPNFRYDGFTNQGTVAGSWTSAYASRLRRHTVSYNNGALTRQLAYNGGSAGRNLTWAGSESATRFLHDGSGYTAYLVLTRRTTTVARLLHTTTSATVTGLLLAGTSGQQSATVSIGNASGAALSLIGTGTQLSSSVPHVLAFKIHPYAGVGTLGASLRVDANAISTANWSAAPNAGAASTSLKIADTLNGHLGSLLIFKDSDLSIAFGDANDVAIMAWLNARFVATPDAWTLPVFGKLVFHGDSITVGSTNGATPWRELLTLSQPFDPQNEAFSGSELGPAATANTLLNRVATDVDVHYNAALPFNIAWLWAGTNDIAIAGRGAVAIKSDMDAWVAGREAVGFTCCVASMLDRATFDAAKRTERDNFNIAVRADQAGAAGFCDTPVAMGPDHSPWGTFPEDWPVAEAPNYTHPFTPGNVKLAAAIAAAINPLLPP